ncbi:MAG: PaaI family thioesterase [Syntrophobacter sp.]
MADGLIYYQEGDFPVIDMNPEKDLRLLPVRENQLCFGCSPLNPSGLHMRFHTDGTALFSWLEVPEHLIGWENMVHGGVITTILDEIMGWSAIYLLKRMTLTKSISIDFLKPVYSQTRLRAEGRLVEVKSEREALMEGLLFDSNDSLRSRAFGTFALFPPDAAKKMGMMDELSVESVERLISS